MTNKMCMHALNLAQMGFWVFRLKPNSKLPAAKGWQQEATRDLIEIAELWGDKDYNIGIYTGKFMSEQALLVIDEDNKGEKKGADTLFQLDFKGDEVPHTRVQTTPTGGRHHIYSCSRAVKQGVDVLGDGLDIRSRGGYIVGAGSTLGGRPYNIDAVAIAEAPGWLFAKLALPSPKERKEVDVSKINPDRARERATRYLEGAPIAEEGSRNDTAFRVVCELKDRGVNQDVCLELAIEWNDNNEPPLDIEEIEIIVGSAYKTGQNAVGVKAPETLFTAIEIEEVKAQGDWFDELNKEYALVLAGGGHHILRETTNAEGKYELQHINEPSFHRMLAHKTVQIGQKQQPQTKIWMSDKETRRYDGLTFVPEREVDPRYFNMWRGFSVKPMQPGEVPTEQAKKALADWLWHAEHNVCGGNKELFHFQMCHFAHTFQRPWEKPLTALVFRGDKGVGKNALIMFINHLLGSHAMVTAKKRYLTSNFNGHFESCLAFTLDEAFWSGDKEAEGTLKDLITGYKHYIEHKGKEGYEVPNLTRIYIISNETWVVPASFDERRFAVFTVLNTMQGKPEFFEEMKNGMFAGGDRLLLSYFLNYDMKGTNINVAPSTSGLIEQKLASLDLQGKWWYNSLMAGELVSARSETKDFEFINCKTFQNAFAQYCKDTNTRGRVPDPVAIGKEFKKMAPHADKKMRSGHGNEYRSRGLAALRKDFETYLKGKIEWPPIETGENDPFI